MACSMLSLNYKPLKMKRYDKYKESGIPWIGNIPEHWEVRMLSQLSQEYFVSNKDIKHQNLLSLSYGRIIQKKIDTTEGLLPASYDTYQVIRRENIVLRLTDLQNDHKSLRVGLSMQEGIITSAYLTLASRSNVNPKFLYFSLHTADIKKVFYGMGSGLRQNLNWKELRKLCLLLPSLAEQEAIVAYLEEKVAQMDSLAAKQEAQIAYLRELKQAIIARAVTQGLDPHAPLRPSGIPWIGNIPEHWEVQRLGRCFGENRSLNSDLECTEAYKFNYGSLIRKDENINPQELVDTYTKYTLLRENDIIINGLNLNYDFVTQRVAIATQKGIITSAYLTLSPRRGINHNYYCLLFKAMDSMKLFHGMGSGIRLTLSYKDLKNQCLPLPPLSEQEAIVTYINRKTEEIDHLIAMTEQEIARIRELKQTLIADVVTGRINVQPS